MATARKTPDKMRTPQSRVQPSEVDTYKFGPNTPTSEFAKRLADRIRRGEVDGDNIVKISPFSIEVRFLIIWADPLHPRNNWSSLLQKFVKDGVTRYRLATEIPMAIKREWEEKGTPPDSAIEWGAVPFQKTTVIRNEPSQPSAPSQRTIYSHSRISTYEDCPQKYKFQCINQVTDGIGSAEAFLGAQVHQTLAHLYVRAINGQLLSEDETLGFYDSEWAANWSKDVQILEPDLFSKHYREIGRQCVQKYYRRHQPFNHSKAIEIEKTLTINLDADGRYQMRGIIDRIDKVADGVFEIHDYKCQSLADLPEVPNQGRDPQSAFYEIGLRSCSSEIREVRVIWHFLRYDMDVESQYYEQQLQQLRTDVIGQIQKLESAVAQDNFPPRESDHCNKCAYHSLCPLWKHLYTVST